MGLLTTESHSAQEYCKMKKSQALNGYSEAHSYYSYSQKCFGSDMKPLISSLSLSSRDQDGGAGKYLKTEGLDPLSKVSES